MTQNERIIRYHAGRCLMSLGKQAIWSMEDLVNEGYICLARAQEKWRPDGGAAFNTYFTTTCKNHYWKIIRKARVAASTCLTTKDPQGKNSSVTMNQETGQLNMGFRHFVISPDAEQFLELALHPPDELVDKLRMEKRTRMSEIIRSWLGWKKQKVSAIERELNRAMIC